MCVSVGPFGVVGPLAAVNRSEAANPKMGTRGCAISARMAQVRGWVLPPGGFFFSISKSSKCTQRAPECGWDLGGFYRDLRAFVGTSGAFIGTSGAFIGSPQLCSRGAEAGGLALTGESLLSWVSNAAWELGKGERTYAPARPALFVALAQRLDARQGVLCCLVGLCCSIPALLAVPWGCPRDGLYNRVASSRSLLRGGCRVRGHPHQNHPFCTNFQGRELV